MFEISKPRNAACQPSYELRTRFLVGELDETLSFIQDEFIVSRQTAKMMVKPGTLLVYHLSKDEAVEHVERYEAKGLLCDVFQMMD